MNKEKVENKKKRIARNAVAICIVILSTFLLSSFTIAAPTGPNGINITANETKATSAAQMINISGGIISKINITASVQNPHWKAFVGWIDGRFTLDDSAGSTIYDWTLSSIGGEVYATRTSSTPDWTNIGCASAAQIEAEDTELVHTGEDNITSTFTDDSNTETFVVAGTNILAGTCAATNTYVGGTKTADFEEVILYDATNSDIIFTTILEEDVTGYDGNDYDFQMLIPENGSETWSGSTAYYLYVELS